MSKTIIIGGNFRGGTTILAKLIETAGIDFHNYHSINYEDIELQAALHNLLNKEGELNRTKLDEANRIIEARNEQYDTWAFKYPAIHQYLNYFIFRNPHYILILRDPMAVALSEQRQHDGNHSLAKVLRTTLSYNSQMVNMFLMNNNVSKIHLVSYEQLMTRTKETIAELLEFLNIEPQHLHQLAQLVKPTAQLDYERTANKDSIAGFYEYISTHNRFKK